VRLAGWGVVVVVVLTAATSARAERAVNFSEGCEGSVARPATIAITCADGKVTFETEEWIRWDETGARAVGQVIYPACPRHVPLYRCRQDSSDAAEVTLWRPAFCPAIDRWQFTRLRLTTSGMTELPSQFEQTSSYTCLGFGTNYSLSGDKASRFLLRALSSDQRAALPAAYGRQIRCGKRLSPIRVRCKGRWFAGDIYFSVQATIWVSFRGGSPFWGYRYRLKRYDEYCAVEGGSRRSCTQRSSRRGHLLAI
jgi:hypothetical protein